MAEQRLIDATDLIARGNASFGGVSDAVLLKKFVDAQPTIDPETFPIVQELREELAREKRLCDNLQKDLAITANERDAALDRVRHYAGCWECKVREEGKCAMPFFKDECIDWEWRGPQKENERGTLDY